MTTNEPDEIESFKPHSLENESPAPAENAQLEKTGSRNPSKQPSQIQDDPPIDQVRKQDHTAKSTEPRHGVQEETPNTAYVHPAEGVSQWSHQALVPQKADAEDKGYEDEWQEMPAYAPYDLYDDDNKLIAREAHDVNDGNPYEGLGGAGKGYTRVQVDEDARSATSMDDNTSYLFKHNKSTGLIDEDDEQRDPLAQMQATKNLLTEGQRIAYVGVTRLAMAIMVKELDDMEGTKATKKELRTASESIKMWSQQMMVRLYAHIEIDSSGRT